MSNDQRTQGPQRVQKILSAAGLASRRASEDLIRQGRVTINGTRVDLGAKADPASDVVAVDGERVHTNPTLAYVLLNKPRGVVTTAHDPQGRPTVMSLVPEQPRVFPVGRLDQDTEGLLLLTNDGELANRITHPKYEIAKTYVVQIRGNVQRQHLRAFTDGVELDDGPARAVSARELGSAADKTLVELVLTEGRKREVRRLVAAVGLTLQRLARVQVGPQPLGDIAPGRSRPLRGQEVAALYRAVGLSEEN